MYLHSLIPLLVGAAAADSMDVARRGLRFNAYDFGSTSRVGSEHSQRQPASQAPFSSGLQKQLAVPIRRSARKPMTARELKLHGYPENIALSCAGLVAAYVCADWLLKVRQKQRVQKPAADGTNAGSAARPRAARPVRAFTPGI